MMLAKVNKIRNNCFCLCCIRCISTADGSGQDLQPDHWLKCLFLAQNTIQAKLTMKGGQGSQKGSQKPSVASGRKTLR